MAFTPRPCPHPPLRLYKYLSFGKKAPDGTAVWDQPVIEGTLFFAPIPALRVGNDEEEFRHAWDTDAAFFAYHGRHIRESYDRLFNNARVLCMSMALTQACWREYCRDGGCCFEFRFDKDIADAAEISSNTIEYADSKLTNAPEFIVPRIQNPTIRALISRTANLQNHEAADVLNWLNSPEGHENLSDVNLDHIYHEIVFKKVRRFAFEQEYRFVHVAERMPPQPPLKTLLVESKLRYEKLGLQLVRIHSSDPKKVAKHFRGLGIDAGVEIVSFYYWRSFFRSLFKLRL